MSTSSRDFIERQRKRLEALREQLLSGEENTLANRRAFQQEHGDEAHELEEEAQELAQRQSDQALYDVNKRRLRNIERALRKIEEGTYGLSDVSSEPIPEARLEASPEAVLTVEEEQAQEKADSVTAGGRS